MSSRSNYQNDPFKSNIKRERETNINKKLNTPTKSYLKESMKGSWCEHDGLPHKRSGENVTSSTSCSQKKLIDWIINIKLLNENLKEAVICKIVKIYLY